MYDLIVVGGGASGVATAIMLKQLNSELSVAVLEKNDRLMKKLAMTGNGRCNILNRNVTPSRFHGSGKNSALGLIDEFDFKKQEEFFENLGVPIVYEGDKGFPFSKQATSVVDCLRFRLDEMGIETFVSTAVKSVVKKNNVFLIETDNETFNSKAVLIACGSATGGKVGSDSGYHILKSLGHKITELHPSIVQIKTEKDCVTPLKGIKINADCRAVSGEKTLKQEYGEVLFCDYGLSGPPILNLSRTVGYNKGVVISLDFFSEYSANELRKILIKRKNNLGSRDCSEFFTGLINKRLGQTVMKRSNIKLSMSVGVLTLKDIDGLVHTLKNYTVTAVGTNGMANAQVAAGGADISGFDGFLMSKKVSGLFAGGEILDIDGDCGGFNLTYCWAAANKISRGIYNYLGKQK